MKAFDIGPLEFEKVAGLVSAHAVCAEAKQRLLELAPGGDYTDATRLLTDTDEAVSILRKLSGPPIRGVVNVAAAVKRAGDVYKRQSRGGCGAGCVNFPF